MINLIPPEGKQLVRREYIIRVAAVWMALSSIALVAVSLMLVPTYVLLTDRAAAISSAFAELANNDETVYQGAQKAIADANALAGQLNKASAPIPSADTLAEVRAAMSSDITLNSFVYTRADDGSTNVQLAGIAETRESLAMFRDALERSPLFVSATIPVSSLARDVNLPFSITVTVEKTAS